MCPVPVGVGSCEWGPQAQTEIASGVMQSQACHIFKLKSWRFIQLEVSVQLEVVSAVLHSSCGQCTTSKPEHTKLEMTKQRNDTTMITGDWH